ARLSPKAARMAPGPRPSSRKVRLSGTRRYLDSTARSACRHLGSDTFQQRRRVVRTHKRKGGAVIAREERRTRAYGRLAGEEQLPAAEGLAAAHEERDVLGRLQRRGD